MMSFKHLLTLLFVNTMQTLRKLFSGLFLNKVSLKVQIDKFDYYNSFVGYFHLRHYLMVKCARSPLAV